MEDWRAFRAKLVFQERHGDETSVPDKSGLDEDIWAYESGPDMLEQGSIILNDPMIESNQDFGFGLGRQYLHKSVVLVLDHDKTTTTGIILNRPTDLILKDEMEGTDDVFACQIWYGGPANSIHTNEPKFYALHSLKSSKARELSKEIFKGIQFTSLQNARTLVEEGFASTDDFWFFCGFMEWPSELLTEELHENFWHSVATDAKTLSNGLRILDAGATADPRDAGLKTWGMLMRMIGRDCDEDESDNMFDDLMLREWAEQHLVFDGPPLFLQEKKPDWITSNNIEEVTIQAGDILRGSSAKPSPFLLTDQEYHKSLILVMQVEPNYAIGVLLNHPTTKTEEVELSSDDTFFHEAIDVHLPVRYGGDFDFIGDEPTLFVLHTSSTLREADVGEPVGYNNEIWSCSMEDVANSIAEGIATMEDFMVIRGCILWEKDIEGGVQGGVGNGNFEFVEQDKTKKILSLLASQKVLSSKTLNSNLKIATTAWSIAEDQYFDEEDEELGSSFPFDITGHAGDEFERYVFKSNVKISALSDHALRTWVATYFLKGSELHP